MVLRMHWKENSHITRKHCFSHLNYLYGHVDIYMIPFNQIQFDSGRWKMGTWACLTSLIQKSDTSIQPTQWIHCNRTLKAHNAYQSKKCKMWKCLEIHNCKKIGHIIPSVCVCVCVPSMPQYITVLNIKVLSLTT